MRWSGVVIPKIDNLATNGLLGVNNSLAYRINELERHFHGWDRRFGLAASPSGETHRADLLGPGVLSFQATTGNNTWGSWLQILGSSDTPSLAGSAYFDFHNILINTANFTGIYYIQVAFGESADLAAKITAKSYSAHIANFTSNTFRTSSATTMTRRHAAGTKAWLRTMVPSEDAKTLNFYIGLHEYEG